MLKGNMRDSVYSEKEVGSLLAVAPKPFFFVTFLFVLLLGSFAVAQYTEDVGDQYADAVVNPGLGEECDDGNTVSGDGCSADLKLEFCGDGILTTINNRTLHLNSSDPAYIEQCDDGNTVSGDGCSETCQTEYCGDGVHQPGFGEACDDGNIISGDGCDGACQVEICGDGVVQTSLGEECDGVSLLEPTSYTCSLQEIEIDYRYISNGSLLLSTTQTFHSDEQSRNVAAEVLGVTDSEISPGTSGSGTTQILINGIGSTTYGYNSTCRDVINSCTGSCTITRNTPTVTLEDNNRSTLCADLIGTPDFYNQCQGRYSSCGLWVELNTSSNCTDSCSARGYVSVPSYYGELSVNSNPKSCHCTYAGADPVSTCTQAKCGNAVLDLSLGEFCDDGNTINGDGCNAECRIEHQVSLPEPNSSMYCSEQFVELTTQRKYLQPYFPNSSFYGDVETDYVTFSGYLSGLYIELYSNNNGGSKIYCPANREGEFACIVHSWKPNPFDRDYDRFSAVHTLNPYLGLNALIPGEVYYTEPIPVKFNHRNIKYFLYRVKVNSTCTDYLTPTAVCGDSSIQAGEECDDGNFLNGDGCDQFCDLEFCGDEILQAAEGEECDYGAFQSGDGCSADCKIEYCGDGITQASLGETCDHGNTVSGDGCSATCQIEFCGDGIITRSNAGTHYEYDQPSKVLPEECDDGNRFPGDGCDMFCQLEYCGDGIRQSVLNEDCDDNNRISGDGCSADCRLEFCGDSRIQSIYGEQCDDGNRIDGDGCSANCNTEQTNTTYFSRLPLTFTGCNLISEDEEYTCLNYFFYTLDANDPNPLAAICGNGIIEIGEQCDNAGLVLGDGCLNDCTYGYCGDGATQGVIGEQCDDGNNVSGDGCSALCLQEYCGDGITQPFHAGLAEECDDGNTNNGDGCSEFCTYEHCGDYIEQPSLGEACDDPTRADNDGCSYFCQFDVVQNFSFNYSLCEVDLNCNITKIPLCGDSIIDITETCDDGNLISGDGCNSTCGVEFCGDNITQPGLGETCEDLNHDPYDGCNECQASTFPANPRYCGLFGNCSLAFYQSPINNYELGSNESCDDGNTITEDGCNNGVVEHCGDGIVQSGLDETCDDGNRINGDGCSVACLDEFCGDGYVSYPSGEQCDDNNSINGDGCNDSCQLEYCGNGNVDDGEGCDDGNRLDGDGCNSVCQIEVCGNSVTDYGEICDDGNIVSGDGCSSSCQLEICGNDIIDPGEQCDDGDVAPGDGCTETCQNEICGDGIVQESLGEECDVGDADDGDVDGCSSTCQNEYCGDSVTQAFRGETCDDGNIVNGDGCSALCLSEVCGDGIVQEPLGEECDVGDADDGDADGCSSTCQNEYCGDSVTQAFRGENCDDGNNDNGDGCSAICLSEVCGDGIQNSPEECDDGNTASGDGCNNICELEYCGDGTTQGGIGEQCDDGNTVGDDGCSWDCQNEVCGDGIVQPNRHFSPIFEEECDDGNAFDGDGCTNSCKVNCSLYEMEMVMELETSPGVWEAVRDDQSTYNIHYFNDTNGGSYPYFTHPVVFNYTPHTAPTRYLSTSYCGTDISGCVGRAEVSRFINTPNHAYFRFYTHISGFHNVFYGGLTDTYMTSNSAIGTAWEIPDDTPKSFTLTSTVDGYIGAPSARVRTRLIGTCIQDEDRMCGDGNIDVDEQCDDGNTNNGDGCDAQCDNEVCGNGAVQYHLGENCDDGNTAAGDGCSATCQLEVCGNGVVDSLSGEQCDDGNTVGNDGCSASCMNEVCGDGILQGSEECDDGNTFNNDGCSSSCFIRCDAYDLDIYVEREMDLDDTNPNFYSDPGGYTNNWLQIHEVGARQLQYWDEQNASFVNPNVPKPLRIRYDPDDMVGFQDIFSITYCGTDHSTCLARTEVQELFDYNHTLLYHTHLSSIHNLYYVGITASTTRTTNYVDISTPHTIGSSGLLPTNAFSSSGFEISTSVIGCEGAPCGRRVRARAVGTCVIEESRGTCGDGIIQTEIGESCDDGNTRNGDGCDFQCDLETCGNGKIQDWIGEDCDDYNAIGGDGCSASCQQEYCGDGQITTTNDVVWGVYDDQNGAVSLPESCDDGNQINGDGCNSICVEEYCGDGIIQASLGEECDDNTAGCSEVCTIISCGNGKLEGTEQCDDGNNVDNDGCSATCIVEGCGNNIIDSGEECDDNTAGCSEICTIVSCGNGKLEGTEKCDDGNLVDGDGCSATCSIEGCGNNITDSGEECDDGNLVNGDGCNSFCVTEVIPSGAQCLQYNLTLYLETERPLGTAFMSDNFTIDTTVDPGNYQVSPVNTNPQNFTYYPANGTRYLRSARCNNNHCTQTQYAEVRNLGQFFQVWTKFSGAYNIYYVGITDLYRASDWDGTPGTPHTIGTNVELPTTLASYTIYTNITSYQGTNIPANLYRVRGRLEGTCVAFPCGDGLHNPGTEECDDGNSANNDGCNSYCELEYCGDNITQPGIGEECDDGNLSGGDGCGPTCQFEICGNGIVDTAIGEECDDGNQVNGDSCDVDCNMEFCGDGVHQLTHGEQCDDGGNQNGDGCTAFCELEYCGDGTTQLALGEQCDDANANDSDGCTSQCINSTYLEMCSSLLPPQCYGIYPIDPAYHDRLHICGDGHHNASAEECDDGNVMSGDGCSSTCTVEPGFCGDGLVFPVLGEECDDGNTINGDGCSAYCQTEVCGDSVVQDSIGEECDDGNTIAGDGCSATCRTEYCGDGIHQATMGEECDVGPFISGDGCSSTCKIEYCGDNTTQIANGEECDDGNKVNHDGCNYFCQIEKCGDGIIQPELGEQCDELSSSYVHNCNHFCQLEVCGDGFNAPFEECDDNNTVSGDGCSSACRVEVCGNRIVDASLGEECDDGNMFSGDGCSSECTIENTSGDGKLDPWEECDDGNLYEFDYCATNMTLRICDRICGDGDLQPAEQCDDGNDINGDGCSALCEFEYCGDNITTTTDPNRHYGSLIFSPVFPEQCDDGNNITGDGCSQYCEIEYCGDDYITTSNPNNFYDNSSGNATIPELCDNGPLNGFFECDEFCQPLVPLQCGDGFPNASAGEECDDGFMFDTNNTVDASNNDGPCVIDFRNPAVSCRNNICGDGYREVSTEQCDDGNNIDNDGCSATCIVEGCGDGIVQADEECDDGRAYDTHYTVNPTDDDGYCVIDPTNPEVSCRYNICGDGYSDLLNEECDTGTDVFETTCSLSCTHVSYCQPI